MKRIKYLIGKRVIRIQVDRVVVNDLDRGVAVIIAENHRFISNQHHHHHPAHVNNRPIQQAFPIKMMKTHRKVNVAHQRNEAKILVKYHRHGNVHVIDPLRNLEAIGTQAHQRNAIRKNERMMPNYRPYRTFNRNCQILPRAENVTSERALVHIRVHVRAHDHGHGHGHDPIHIHRNAKIRAKARAKAKVEAGLVHVPILILVLGLAHALALTQEPGNSILPAKLFVLDSKVQSSVFSTFVFFVILLQIYRNQEKISFP